MTTCRTRNRYHGSLSFRPDFSPSTYLSSLRNRHQTLNDLRTELRQRSQSLGKELLDLVNNEYQAFLGLGRDLKGGDEKVEGVKVGVLGFVKGVEGVKESVHQRSVEVGRLVEERQKIAKDKDLARTLVEIHTRLEELEDALTVGGARKEQLSDDTDEEDDEDEDAEEEESGTVHLVKLQRLVHSYLATRKMAQNAGMEHPFLVKQEERMTRLQNTLLLDLGTALKQATQAGSKRKQLTIVSLYGEMDEAAAAIKVLQETKT